MHMKLSALLLIAGLGLIAVTPAAAKTRTTTNANVRRAQRKSKKGFKAVKYKAPKHSKKPKAAKYGVTRLSRHT
jgi:hypothetical protein